MIYQVHDSPTKNSTEAPASATNLGKLQCRHPFHSAYACGGICVGMDPVYRARYIHSFAYPLQHPNFSASVWRFPRDKFTVPPLGACCSRLVGALVGSCRV